jgi:pyruvate dehydrogenase E2 component (dihydrolipoamide acetyltransferase)
MITKVVMPKLSEAMETGKVIKWLKKVGDPIKGGDVIAEVETDKANVEIEAFGSGVLRKIIVVEGGQVPVGELIAVIAEPSDDIAALSAAVPKPVAPVGRGAAAGEPSGSVIAPPQAAAPPLPAMETYKSEPATTMVMPLAPGAAPTISTGGSTAAPLASPSPSARQATAAPPTTTSGGRVKASPLARKIAAQSGVDLRVLQGSGPGGRIVRRDVETAMAAPRPTAAAAFSTGGSPAAAPPKAIRPAFVIPPRAAAEFEDVPLSPMRAAIAKVMPLSKGPVPHFYVTSEVAMDRAGELRGELNALEGQPKISVNDLIIKACALALRKNPGVNARLNGQAIRVHHRAHIGVAVSLDAGLITPVLHDCDVKPLSQIAVEARDLAERARAGKLRAQELTGATFSISNLGMFDVEEFSAIINPPEGAILAVGSVLEKPVVMDGALAVGLRMKMTISCDHRVMDGAMGARFLQDVKRLLEEPLRLLV